MLLRRFPSILAKRCNLKHFNLFSTEIHPLNKLRNIAIVAHVDHGKTSLVDQLLIQTGIKNTETCVMDSNDLEKERGITIVSKSTAIEYKGHRINIVDTPGHADFGGEVERVLSMVDGICLVVCATEGPMAQTKFVLRKALDLGKIPIVVMNKVDRDTANPSRVENELLELFIELDANDEQLNYPIIYGSAKNGFFSLDLEDKSLGIVPLLDKMLELPNPKAKRDDPFSMLVTQVENDQFVGKCYLGKIESGQINVGDIIRSIDTDGKITSEGKCTKILRKLGLTHESVTTAMAGDIISVSGLPDAKVNFTIGSDKITEPLPFVPVDQPTISMTFYVNDSPLSGREGKLLTSQVIKARLLKETETNVSLQVIEKSDGFEVKGRGELQMGVLIETMRREGFELSVSPPQVIYKRSETDPKEILEPVEEVTIDTDSEFAGVVIEKLTARKGEMKTYDDIGNRVKIVFEVPTRGLLGYPAEFKNDTHGHGTLNQSLIGYLPFKGVIDKVRKGSLISSASGQTTSYALSGIEPRGKLFIGPGVQVYPGMIIGEHNRETDMEVNPVKSKQMTNIRAAGKDDTIKLTPPETLDLERMISYIQGY